MPATKGGGSGTPENQIRTLPAAETVIYGRMGRAILPDHRIKMGFVMSSLTITLIAALASLAGSEWVPKTDATPERFVQFKEADVAGKAGCNRFFGRYAFDGAAIKIGPLASTRMACPAEVMEAEQAWLLMLESARSAEASGKELVLKDAAGLVIATLKRRDLD